MASIKFNPFRPGSLVSPGMFAGRHKELEILERVLFQTKNGNPLHFLIRGERGIGKSSLLLVLKSIAQGEMLSLQNNKYHFLVVNIELEPNTTYREIIKRVGAEFQREIFQHDKAKELARRAWDFLKKWEILGVKYSGDLRDLEPHELLDDLASTIDVTMKATKSVFDGLVITIDEADKPPSSANLGEFCKLLTERLMKRGCEKVVLGISGLPQTVDRLKESHESAPRVFKDIYLQPLTAEDRVDVVRKGLIEAKKVNKHETGITPEAENLISEFSEGYPHFIQQFAYSAFDYDDNDRIDEEDVRTGAFMKHGAFYELGVKYFQGQYFDQIGSDEYRKVLRAMAEHLDAWVTKAQIRQAVNLKTSTLDNAISALKERNIIIAKPGKKGEYRLPNRSFAVWIKAYTSNGH
jgi:predicted transcriptional regulator